MKSINKTCARYVSGQGQCLKTASFYQSPQSNLKCLQLCSILLLLLLFVAQRVPEIQCLGAQNQLKNGFKASRIRLFFIFCQISVIVHYFSKFHSIEQIFQAFDTQSIEGLPMIHPTPTKIRSSSVLKKHSIWQKFGKK